jgi:hypothetical protein
LAQDLAFFIRDRVFAITLGKPNPSDQDTNRVGVSDCRRFARVLGTVTRAVPVKVAQEFRTFRYAECGNKFTLRAHPASGYEFEVPKQEAPRI